MVGEVLNVMKQLATTGLTMVIVTHEMAFARDVSTRTIFMDGGYVAEDAPPSQLFTNPKKSPDQRISQQIPGRVETGGM